MSSDLPRNTSGFAASSTVSAASVYTIPSTVVCGTASTGAGDPAATATAPNTPKEIITRDHRTVLLHPPATTRPTHHRHYNIRVDQVSRTICVLIMLRGGGVLEFPRVWRT